MPAAECNTFTPDTLRQSRGPASIRVNPLDRPRSASHDFAMKKSIVAVVVCLGAGLLVQAAQPTLHTFRKIQLTDEFWGEGAYYGDFNKDGKQDVVYGPYWWEGPDFKARHEFRPATQTFKLKKADGTEATVAGYEGGLGKNNAYSDAFFTFAHDFNKDGWDDIMVFGLPGTEAWIYQNPKGKSGEGGSEHWKKHKVFNVVDNESPMWGDITGDGKPEIICNSGGFMGYIEPDWNAPFQPWQFHPVSPKGKYHKYTHGVGFGDVNGDGRSDLLEAEGWWEQPATQAGSTEWKFHKFPFAPDSGAAQMHAYDVNGDGLNDIITTLNPHGYGLVWWEQQKEGGAVTFKQHLIMGKEPKENKYGVKFTQPHAIELVDMDGDGALDILTGKRFWAHGPAGDPESNAAAVLYWFRLVRGAGGSVEYVPHLIDDNSGVGTQVAPTDLNGDSRPDVVMGNKKGMFVFLHQVKQVSQAEWDKAQPKPAPAE